MVRLLGVMSGYLGVNAPKRCSPSLRCFGYGPLDICTSILENGFTTKNIYKIMNLNANYSTEEFQLGKPGFSMMTNI